MIIDLWIMVFLKQNKNIAKVLLFILIHTGWYENTILNPLLNIRYHGNYIETGSDSCNGNIQSMLIKNIVIFETNIQKNVKFWKHLHRSIIVLVNEVGER